MSAQNDSSEKTGNSKPKQRGIIGGIISLILTVLWMNLLAWFLLLLWFDAYRIIQGSQASYQRMNDIVHTNIALLRNTAIGTENGYQVFESNEKQLAISLFNNRYLHQGMAYLEQKRDTVAARRISTTKKNLLGGIAHSLKESSREVVPILWGVTLIVFTRMFIFLLALPLFFLCIALGLVDGLVQRDIRKFQAARESTWIFHQVKKGFSFWFFIPLFGYLALPWAVSPVGFLVPIALGSGVLMQLSMRYFKKYA